MGHTWGVRSREVIKVAVQLFDMVREVPNGHFGRFFQIHVDVVLLTFFCVLGEDGQQMELGTVFKRLHRFCAGCVMGLAFEIGPRVRTNLASNDLVPFG